MKNTIHSNQTKMLYFPDFFTYLSAKKRPSKDPTITQVPIKVPYLKFNIPDNQFIRDAFIPLNITKYIPVDAATLGFTPKDNNAGL